MYIGMNKQGKTFYFGGSSKDTVLLSGLTNIEIVIEFDKLLFKLSNDNEEKSLRTPTGKLKKSFSKASVYDKLKNTYGYTGGHLEVTYDKVTKTFVHQLEVAKW